MPSISPTYADLALPPAAALATGFARHAYVLCPAALAPESARDLREHALALARRHARRIEQVSGEHVLRYRVVPGDVVCDEWPELFALFRAPQLAAWVAAVASVPAVFPSAHLRSAVNINVLGEPDEVYRWHTDAAGLTLLLYLSDSGDEDGGELELRAPDGVVSWRPAAGAVILMDGTRCPHRVAPVRRAHERVSVPMVFVPGGEAARPAGLDDYLYRI